MALDVVREHLAITTVFDPTSRSAMHFTFSILNEHFVQERNAQGRPCSGINVSSASVVPIRVSGTLKPVAPSDSVRRNRRGKIYIYISL
jgi:hypothetical protein